MCFIFWILCIITGNIYSLGFLLWIHHVIRILRCWQFCPCWEYCFEFEPFAATDIARHLFKKWFVACSLIRLIQIYWQNFWLKQWTISFIHSMVYIWHRHIASWTLYIIPTHSHVINPPSPSTVVLWGKGIGEWLYPNILYRCSCLSMS